MSKSSQSVVIITGAGSGIGRACAILLAKSGYRVALVGRRRENLEQTKDLIEDQDQALVIEADLSKTFDRQKIVDETITHFGRIDAVINNAGIGTHKVLADLSNNEIESLFAINSIGPIDLVRVALPELIINKGAVINVASVAISDPFVGLGVYGASKCAIDGLTRGIHNEYHDQGVRAWTLAPGAVETDMLRGIVSKEDLPTELTLTPERIAQEIRSFLDGTHPEPSGSTVFIDQSTAS